MVLSGHSLALIAHTSLAHFVWEASQVRSLLTFALRVLLAQYLIVFQLYKTVSSFFIVGLHSGLVGSHTSKTDPSLHKHPLLIPWNLPISKGL